MLTLTILVASLASLTTGCPRPRPYGSLVASRGASSLLRDLALALRDSSGDRLVGLLTERCVARCPGFRFAPDGREGAIRRFRWRGRPGAGSLAEDLYGQLRLYKKIDRVALSFLSLRFSSHLSAEAEIALEVDGLLANGARRSDRGSLALALRRSVDGTWKIDGFGADGMRTVVSTRALFEDRTPKSWAQTIPKLRILPHDPGIPGADLGPGLAAADVNGDGMMDLFLPGPGLGRLLLGTGKGQLGSGKRLLSTLDRGVAAVFGDSDGDGDPDLLVLRNAASAVLLTNSGGGRFRLRSISSLARLGPISSAAWLDIDGDGRLDLLLSTRQGLALLRNRVRGFVLDSGRLPAAVRRYSGGKRIVALCTGDLDGDGSTDAVAVDALGPTRVLLNRRGRLAPAPAPGATVLGRACAIADLDGDGRLDVLVAAVRSDQAWKYSTPGFPLPGSPFRKPRGLVERLATAAAGSFWLRSTAAGFVKAPLANPASMGWDVTLAAADLDADGRVDVLLAGGNRPGKGTPLDPMYFTRALPRQLLGLPWEPLSSQRPLGATRGATLLLGTSSGRADVGRPAGLDVPAGVRAALFLDLDRDGTPELLLRLRDGSLRLWRWRQPRGNALTLRLLGRGVPASGATVTAWSLGRRFTSALDGGTAGVGEVRLGMGSALRADRVEIRWPDGSRQVVQDLSTRAAYRIARGAENPLAGLAPSPAVATGTPPRTPPETAPPARLGVVAGLDLARLGDLRVIPVGPAPASGRAAGALLRHHFGSRATLLLLLPARCKACPGYLRKLARLGRVWQRRGVAALALGGRSLRKLPWITRLRSTPGQSIRPYPDTRLLLLDSSGRVRLIYLDSLPPVMVLVHHLQRLTAP